MKNIKKLILFALLGMLSFAQTASGQTITQADVTRDSSRIAFSPFAQAVPNDSYTFIGVSHPSLDTALTQIGVVIEAIDMTTGSPTTVANRATVFTIDAGETHRVFIVNKAHATINSSNAAITSDARVHLIPTIDSAQFGSVRVTTVATAPTTAVAVGSTSKYQNLSQLNLWGVIFVEAGGTGFAMEFVGDMADSSPGGLISALGPKPLTGQTTPGRGIN